MNLSTLFILEYIASYRDLTNVFGTNTAAAGQHYKTSGVPEGRTVSFDAWAYLASYGDLRNAFGLDVENATRHFITSGVIEGRTVTFDGLSYLASYADLRGAFGSDADAATRHYVQYGAQEGRSITFDAWGYLASYADLRAAFNTDVQAAALHYIRFGAQEGRTVTFDAWGYLASYGDLLDAFGSDVQAGMRHYVQNGANEGRKTDEFVLNNPIAADIAYAYEVSMVSVAEFYVRENTDGTNDDAKIFGVRTGTLGENTASVSGAASVVDVDNASQFSASTQTGSYGVLTIDTAGAWVYNLTASMDSLSAGESALDTVTVTSADGTPQAITVS
ncbi:VCBS domain-containing protein, partial [Limnohabitans sp.]|uniref:VCBS domain-containing protein n=1 Tax=Limnohabitans sp. TaxID=1907725 RepID=UPI0037C14C1C